MHEKEITTTKVKKPTGFQKGNQLWKKAFATREEKRAKLDTFFDTLAEDGMEAFGEKLGELANGVELTKPEMAYLSKIEGLIPYIRGKRGNVDDKGDTIPTNINILNLSTDELTKLTKGSSGN